LWLGRWEGLSWVVLVQGLSQGCCQAFGWPCSQLMSWMQLEDVLLRQFTGEALLFKIVCIPESFPEQALTLWTICCKYARSLLNQRSKYWSLIRRIDHFKLSFSLQNWWNAVYGKRYFLVYISRVERKLCFKDGMET
jgi:hypothetical protein